MLLLVVSVFNAVATIVFGRIKDFPAGGRENVFVPFIPPPFNDFPGVTFILFNSSIDCSNANVVVYVEVKQRPRLSASFGDDQFVKGQILWEDEILLHVYQGIR